MAGTPPDDTSDMDLPPINEWVVVELSRTKDTLADLAIRHENIVNRLADVCRRNDRMQEIGNLMRDLLSEVAADRASALEAGAIQFAIQMWGEANA